MSLFDQPFPHSSDLKSRLVTAGSFGIFICVFLLIFRPFDMDALPKSTLIKSSVIFGLVTFGCILGTNYLAEIIFPGIFAEEKWTTGKQIINIAVVVLLVGIVNYLLFPLLFGMNLNWANFFRAQAFTISVGLLPIIIYTLFTHNRWLTRFREEAAVLQKKLEEKKQEPENIPRSQSQTILTIISDSEKEKLSLKESELVYIESASNYIKVYFEHKGKLSFTILRTTLKKVEDLFTDSSVLFRCHRAYIVNLDKVETVEGNAQGYKLKIKDSEERIPVSRSLNKEFSDRLLAIRRATHIYPAAQ